MAELRPGLCTHAEQSAFGCWQAYGAKQYRLLGQQLQRGLLISCIVVLLICGVWTQLHPLLLLLGASPGSSTDVAIARSVIRCCTSVPRRM